MTTLTVVVVIIGLLAVFNLALTIALARRHAVLVATVAEGMTMSDRSGLAMGMEAPALSGHDAQEQATYEASPTGPRMIAFVTPFCEGCASMMKMWSKEWKRFERLGLEATIVVDGEMADSKHIIDAAQGSSTPVVFAPRHSSTSLEDWKVVNYPTLYLIDGDGSIKRKAQSLTTLATSSPQS